MRLAALTFSWGVQMSKKIGEMTKEELANFLADVPAITKEDEEEYGIPDVEINAEGYCDDAEVVRKSLECLAAKYETAAVIAEAKKK